MIAFKDPKSSTCTHHNAKSVTKFYPKGATNKLFNVLFRYKRTAKDQRFKEDLKNLKNTQKIISKKRKKKITLEETNGEK